MRRTTDEGRVSDPVVPSLRRRDGSGKPIDLDLELKPMTNSNQSLTDPSPAPPPWQRYVPLLIVVIGTLTLVGFLQGIADVRPPARQRVSHRPDSSNATAARPARSYRELAAAPLSINADRHPSLATLKFEKPGLFDRVVRTPELKLAALADRAANRAYDGAPPVIPHPVDQQSVNNCLACHRDGIQVGDRIATRISHAHFNGCTQCHVESRNSSPVPDEPVTANAFAGMQRSGAGTRALIGSPPVMPHATWLREDCLSCHGLVARAGLRTTHPWLSNCTQCHAPSSELDRVPFATSMSETNEVQPAKSLTTHTSPRSDGYPNAN